MKKTSKWPSRALNLLVVLAMVISLSALIAPPIVAQEQTPDCNPTPVYNGCHLEVAVSTYIKTADGEFNPETDFSPGDCFYVNAVVVNTGNATAYEPIRATITLEEGLELAVPAEVATHGVLVDTKEWANGNLTNASPQGLMADFWWKVCCTAADGSNLIRVNATSASTCDQPLPAEGCTHVNQGQGPGEQPCPVVEIVEAPGMGDKPITVTESELLEAGKTQRLGNYTMSMPNPVAPCTNFGIKAEVTNTCGYPLSNVMVLIHWTGPASLVGGDPDTWNIGDLAPGETKGVGWTLHCDDPGDVVVWVDLPGFPNEFLFDDPWTVHQQGGSGILVDITQPSCTTDPCNPTCEIVQPSGDCGAENFDVSATITNIGDSELVLVYATLTMSPSTGWARLTSGSPIAGPFSLAAGASTSWTYHMECIGNGTGNVTVTGTGNVFATGEPVSDDDFVTIRQTFITAEATPDPAYAIPDEVNKCQEFPVTFRYMNYSGAAWNDDIQAPGAGNITACINWERDSATFYDSCGNSQVRTGNATLIDSVYFRRVVGGIPEAWQLLSNNPAYGNQQIVVTGNDTEGYTSCIHIPVICNCCGVDVRWTFKCMEVGPVKFSSRIDVQQIAGFVDNALSENVCVNQVWKAHLIADSFFFIQTDPGEMLMQEAVVPGTQFHIIIPVMNTGDADAQNVQVYFTVTDAPEGCTDSYRVVSTSGDGTISFNESTGVGIATFQTVPAHKAVKAVMTLECLCEGHVTVWVPDAVVAWGGTKGVRGYDENTGLAIPQANIIVPPCPREMEQIPFIVEIVNPYTCQTFTLNQTFPVKAKITNGSSEDLIDVYATLSWGVGDNVELVATQTATKLVGNITAGSFTEITWELRCTGDSHDDGEVYLQVTAESSRPSLRAVSDEVNVHQTAPPGACLSVYILSPDEHQVGQDWDVGRSRTMIATGQQFAVTAKVENSITADPAENVYVHIGDCSYGGILHYVTLLSPSATQGPFDLDPGEQQIVTWTLSGGTEHDFWMGGCSAVNDTICVNATMDTQWACGDGRDSAESAGDSVGVSVYPAAFLVTEIEASAGASQGEFTVDYRITNIGTADATTVVPNLSVSPYGAAVFDDMDYTARTIPGWNFDEPFNYIEGSFTVVATGDSPFEVIVGPTGEDECGWHAVLGADCSYDEECEGMYNWIQNALQPIQSRFLVLDRVTLDPSGEIVCSDLTSVDIELNSGWNLISLPLIPDDGSVPTLFAGLPVTAIWEYSGGAWSVPSVLEDGKGYWVYMTAAATLTVDGMVNPLPPETPPTYEVAAGWNLIGFKSTCARTAGAYLYGVPFVRIWGFASGAWVPIQSGDNMQPGLGYWVAATGTGTIFP